MVYVCYFRMFTYINGTTLDVCQLERVLLSSSYAHLQIVTLNHRYFVDRIAVYKQPMPFCAYIFTTTVDTCTTFPEDVNIRFVKKKGFSFQPYNVVELR